MSFLKSLKQILSPIQNDPKQEIYDLIRANEKSSPGFANDLKAALARHEEKEYETSNA